MAQCNLEVQFISVYKMRIKTASFNANLSQPHECTCAEILGEIKKMIDKQSPENFTSNFHSSHDEVHVQLVFISVFISKSV